MESLYRDPSFADLRAFPFETLSLQDLCSPMKTLISPLSSPSTSPVPSPTPTQVPGSVSGPPSPLSSLPSSRSSSPELTVPEPVSQEPADSKPAVPLPRLTRPTPLAAPLPVPPLGGLGSAMLSACHQGYPGLSPALPLHLRQAALEAQFRSALSRGNETRPLLDLYVRAAGALEAEREACARTTQHWMLPMVYAYYNQQMALLVDRVEASLHYVHVQHQAYRHLHAQHRADQSLRHQINKTLNAHQTVDAPKTLPAHQTDRALPGRSSRAPYAPAAPASRPTPKVKAVSSLTRKSALCGVPPAGGSAARRGARALNPVAVRIMTKWYAQNEQHPYPGADTVDVMAEAGGVTPSQVRKWFANKRKRSGTTKTMSEIAASRYRGQTLSLLMADSGARH